MKHLAKEGYIFGDALDYGCGKGFDAEQLEMHSYDPHYQPVWPPFLYDTITCNYVLNVIPVEYEADIMGKIKSLLKPNGIAYITVRRDIKNEGLTKRGTYQRNVTLNLKSIMHRKGAFETYELRGE